MEETIRERLEDALACITEARDRLTGPLAEAARIIVDALRQGRGVYIFGNGGSAADAQHMTGELVGRFLADRQSLRAVALTTDTSILTAVANDLGFEEIFARQLEGLAGAGDVAVVLSTSGNSPNILRGLHQARQQGMSTVVLTGRGGGKSAELADVLLDVDSTLSPRIQEVHAVLYHTLCELVEREFIGND
ncbi:MAG: SIS domain-containing protein [Phycisphaerae bacterium]